MEESQQRFDETTSVVCQDHAKSLGIKISDEAIQLLQQIATAQLSK